MSVELKSHNQQAYEQVKQLFERSDRAAVVHPTGTGKSYIALKLIEENPGKKVIYLSPSTSIMHQLKRNMIKDGVDFRSLDRYTYQKLTAINRNNEMNLDADIIILDEFHHCGAPEWGKAVGELLAQNPNAKVLGLSATPMRYFDEEVRDMAEELFDENIASEMTLAEAIEQGILREPIYTTGIYEAEEIVREEAEKIDKLPEGENKESAKKELEELKTALNASVEGLPELLENSMTNNSGKYIVYCKNIKDMQMKMAEAQKMFGKVNPQMEVFNVSSEKTDIENNRQIRRFEKDDDSEKLRLLFSVDMLNEGYHLPDLDGVIMMRPTHSPTLYDQQLGRALSVGGERPPIVIDLVNNIDTIEIIENFSRQFGENSIGEENTTTRKFAISEQTRRIRDVIKKIDALVKRRAYLSNEDKLDLMLEYMRETGEPISHDTVYKGQPIGSMKNTLRYQYYNGTLKIDEELLQKFIDSGIISKEKARITLSPQEKLDLMLEYMRETGETIKANTVYKGQAIGSMRSNLRASYWNGTLKMDEKTLQAFIDNGIITEEKERERTTYQEKYEFLMSMAGKESEDLKNASMESGLTYDNARKAIQRAYNIGELRLEPEQIENLKKCGILNLSTQEIEEINKQYGIPKKYINRIIKEFGTVEEFIDKYKRGECDFDFDIQTFVGARGVVISSKELTEERKLAYYNLFNDMDIDVYMNVEHAVWDIDIFREKLSESLGSESYVAWYYGLDGKKRTLKEIASIAGITTGAMGAKIKKQLRRFSQRYYRDKMKEAYIVDPLYSEVDEQGNPEVEKNLNRMLEREAVIYDFETILMHMYENNESNITLKKLGIRDETLNIIMKHFLVNINQDEIKIGDLDVLVSDSMQDFVASYIRDTKERREQRAKIDKIMEEHKQFEEQYSKAIEFYLTEEKIFKPKSVVPAFRRETNEISNAIVDNENTASHNTTDKKEIGLTIANIELDIREMIYLHRAGFETVNDIVSGITTNEELEKRLKSVKGLSDESIKSIILRVKDYVEISEDTQEQIKSDETEPAEHTNDFKTMTIDELSLSVRAFNCLMRANIRTVERILECYDEERENWEELIKIRNLSPQCVREILRKLEKIGAVKDGKPISLVESPSKTEDSSPKNMIGQADNKEECEQIMGDSSEKDNQGTEVQQILKSIKEHQSELKRLQAELAKHGISLDGLSSVDGINLDDDSGDTPPIGDNR